MTDMTESAKIPRHDVTASDSKATRRGVWNRLVGPLRPIQSAVVLVSAAAAAIGVGVSTLPVGRVPAALMAAVAFDLIGGLMAFQLPATRAAYETSPVVSRIGFAMAHVQAFVIPLTGQGPWSTACSRYAAALGSTVLLEVALPSSPRRRAAAAAMAMACSLADVAASRGANQRWLGPVILLKVIGGHASIPRSSRSCAGGHGLDVQHRSCR